MTQSNPNDACDVRFGDLINDENYREAKAFRDNLSNSIHELVLGTSPWTWAHELDRLIQNGSFHELATEHDARVSHMTDLAHLNHVLAQADQVRAAQQVSSSSSRQQHQGGGSRRTGHQAPGGPAPSPSGKGAHR